MLVVPKVLPRLPTIVGAEDPAGADAVVELAGGVDDVRVRRVYLDNVVVEALAAAVVLDLVPGLGVTGELCPARALVGRLEDLGWVVPRRVPPVQARVEGRGLPDGMRDPDREARLIRREVAGRKAGHDRRPRGAGVNALVHRVAPERGVQDARVLGVHLDIGGAVGLRYGFLQKRPGDCAVL